MGLELENPFGYDSNDLPLSEICATLRREIDYGFEHPVAKSATWEFVSRGVQWEQLERELAMENALSSEELDRSRRKLTLL